MSNVLLRQRVEQDLADRYSPEQIVGRLRVDFPDDPGMRVSVETIYQSLYVPSRGGLRRDLARRGASFDVRGVKQGSARTTFLTWSAMVRAEHAAALSACL